MARMGKSSRSLHIIAKRETNPRHQHVWGWFSFGLSSLRHPSLSLLLCVCVYDEGEREGNDRQRRKHTHGPLFP